MRAPLVFITTALAFAQSAVDPNDYIDKQNLDNADVNQLWRTLGISGKIRETTADGSRDTNQSFNCGMHDYDYCEGQYFNLSWPLLEGDGEEVVVRISHGYEWSRFLVFHHGKIAWQLLDYLDSTDSHYSRAKASVIYSGGKGWLVVTSAPRCGTGCGLEPSNWFDLKNGKLRKVLTVPVEGNQGNENPARQFENRFVRRSESEGRETFEFIYHVEFFAGFGSSIKGVLWGDEKVIRFSRPSGEGQFKFDPKISEASEAFVENVFNSYEIGQPGLLGLIQDRLLEIARGPKDKRLDWLKELLEKNPNLPELAPVRETVTKAR